MKFSIAVVVVLMFSRPVQAQEHFFDVGEGLQRYSSARMMPAGIVLPSEIPFFLNNREFASGINLHAAPFDLPDSGQVDSLQSPVKRKLLPDNMSFMERGLWGEGGFFRSVGIASPLTPEVRKSELGLRRTMLTAHQIGGFVTLGLMGTAVYFGQKVMDGRNDLRGNHQTFVAATIISYSATGLLAILSPPPLIRRNETSTTTIHKTLAWVHFAGMVLTPILGSMIGKRSSSADQYTQRERFHQISAYITTAVFAASMIVITF